MNNTSSRTVVVPAAAAALIAAALAGGCTSDDGSTSSNTGPPAATTTDRTGSAPLPQGSEPVSIDPAEFTPDITNPYWPMQVGDRWVYEEREGSTTQRVVVTVLDRTKSVAAGIEARVVRDVVTQNGVLIEDTFDWYAQDADGNIWYVGEATTEFDNGKPVSTAGSWEAGVGGALPGILMPATPDVGQAYRQEFLAGEAEDAGAVVSLDERVQTPAGSFSDVLMTRDTTPLEPDIVELKFYAPGVGPVLVLQTSGGTSTETLVRSTRT